jgi:hypothetical protein
MRDKGATMHRTADGVFIVMEKAHLDGTRGAERSWTR